MEFDGTGDYLIARDSDDLELGSGDFTIEFWINLNSGPANNIGAIVVSKWNVSNYSYSAGLFNNAGTLQLFFQYSTSGSAATATISANQSLSAGVWYHIAYVRNGSSFKIFLDGVEKTSSATISGTLFNGSEPLNIGRTGDNFNYVNGFIDDLRITKGVARYTAAFTAPTKAFPDL
jgi:hypothetical protein